MPPPGGDNSIPTRATDSSSLQKISLVDSELSEMGDNDRLKKNVGEGQRDTKLTPTHHVYLCLHSQPSAC